jgi:hypothetical protein
MAMGVLRRWKMDKCEHETTIYKSEVGRFSIQKCTALCGRYLVVEKVGLMSVTRYAMKLYRDALLCMAILAASSPQQKENVL